MKKIIQFSIAAALIAATGSATAWWNGPGWGSDRNVFYGDYTLGMSGKRGCECSLPVLSLPGLQYDGCNRRGYYGYAPNDTYDNDTYDYDY
ncbi:MAG: hypothetical protein AB2690_22235 [Candidatus Thiodiazotropha endolucinida]